MDSRTALGRDVIRTIIGWRLKESLLFIPSDDFEDEREIDKACTEARKEFVDRLTNVAMADAAKMKVAAFLVTPDEAERLFGPLAGRIAEAMNAGREGDEIARRVRIERAGLIGFVRACAPASARYCIEPVETLYQDAGALADFVSENDLRLEDLDETAYHAFLRRTTTPEAFRSRIKSHVSRVTDEEPLLAQFVHAFGREFPDPTEYDSVEEELRLNDASQMAADLADVREDIDNIIDDVVDEVWPRG